MKTISRGYENRRRENEMERLMHIIKQMQLWFPIWIYPADQFLDQRAEHAVIHTWDKQLLNLFASPAHTISHFISGSFPFTGFRFEMNSLSFLCLQQLVQSSVNTVIAPRTNLDLMRQQTLVLSFCFERTKNQNQNPRITLFHIVT